MSTIPDATPPPPFGPAGPARLPARPPAAAGGVGRAQNAAASAGAAFADALAQAERAQGAGSLRFSRHALQRVQQRGIQLDSATLGRLATGVARAAGKGSRDSVVLVDGTAFVVSVANRTVLTAVPHERASEPVFTNIDSAVIA
jgi:flagellar operon protein